MSLNSASPHFSFLWGLFPPFFLFSLIFFLFTFLSFVSFLLALCQLCFLFPLHLPSASPPPLMNYLWSLGRESCDQSTGIFWWVLDNHRQGCKTIIELQTGTRTCTYSNCQTHFTAEKGCIPLGSEEERRIYTVFFCLALGDVHLRSRNIIFRYVICITVLLKGPSRDGAAFSKQCTRIKDGLCTEKSLGKGK